MNKTVIAPFVALGALVIKSILHIELSNEIQDGIVVGILAIFSAYGVWKNHKKEVK
jgi:hypothetical protein